MGNFKFAGSIFWQVLYFHFSKLAVLTVNFTVSMNVAILNYISSSHWVRPHLQHFIWSNWLHSSGVKYSSFSCGNRQKWFHTHVICKFGDNFWVVADNRLPMDGEIPKMVLVDKYLIPHPISLVVCYSFPVSKISCTCLVWPVYHIGRLLQHSEENIVAILAPWRKLGCRLSHRLDK